MTGWLGGQRRVVANTPGATNSVRGQVQPSDALERATCTNLLQAARLLAGALGWMREFCIGRAGVHLEWHLESWRGASLLSSLALCLGGARIGDTMGAHQAAPLPSGLRLRSAHAPRPSSSPSSSPSGAPSPSAAKLSRPQTGTASLEAASRWRRTGVSWPCPLHARPWRLPVRLASGEGQAGGPSRGRGGASEGEETGRTQRPGSRRRWPLTRLWAARDLSALSPWLAVGRSALGVTYSALSAQASRKRARNGSFAWTIIDSRAPSRQTSGPSGPPGAGRLQAARCRRA